MLEALDHADADRAAEALTGLDTRAYRTFNMVVPTIAGPFGCATSARKGPGESSSSLAPGYSMITAHDRNDRESARIRANLPRFERAAVPDPERGEWTAWQAILASRGQDAEENSRENADEYAMCVVTERGFGTSSSSLIALPSRDRAGVRPRWLFAKGRPGEAPFLPIVL